jgi:hypothetical protein
LLAELALVAEPAESPLELPPDALSLPLDFSVVLEPEALLELPSPLLPSPLLPSLAAEAELSLLSELLSELDGELELGAEFLWA